VASDQYPSLCSSFKMFVYQIPEFRNLLGSEFMSKYQFLFSEMPQANIGVSESNMMVEAFSMIMKNETKHNNITSEMFQSIRRRFGFMTTNEKMELNPFVLDALTLFMKLDTYFHEDIGCFAGLLLNHLNLSKGEAMFIPPNTLHAYIRGDCVECMACSDNVVRGGLTPKHKDIRLLLEMMSSPSCLSVPTPYIVTPKKVCSECVVYEPPIDEFRIHKFEISPGKSASPVEGSPNFCSILIIISGQGNVMMSSVTRLSVDKGSVVLIAPSIKIELLNSSNNDELIAFMASSRK